MFTYPTLVIKYNSRSETSYKNRTRDKAEIQIDQRTYDIKRSSVMVKERERDQT